MKVQERAAADVALVLPDIPVNPAVTVQVPDIIESFAAHAAQERRLWADGAVVQAHVHAQTACELELRRT